jgi:hypothetical protein
LFLNVDESGRRLDGGVPVAGYVSSLFNAGPRQPATSDVFLSIDAASVRAVYYVVRGNRSTVDAIARSLLAMTPTLEASPQVISIEDRIRSTQSNERLSIALISPTAATCLIGILCGVFANITSLIASRRREIAIREALGSPFSRLAREVVGGELAAASAGMFVGIILTVFASQVMLNQGWSVQPSPSMIAVTLFLLTSATGVAVVAALRRLPRGSAAMLARWGVD